MAEGGKEDITEYQELDPKTTVLTLAIEALGFDDESIKILKQTEYHHNILRNTFLRKSIQNLDFEGVGSRYEGLEVGYYSTDESTENTDIAFLYNSTSEPVEPYRHLEKKILSLPDDWIISPCASFPGYVNLKHPLEGFLSTRYPISYEYVPYTAKLPPNYRAVMPVEGGPTLTKHLDFRGKEKCHAICYSYKSWPVEARCWENRHKPNNWPSKQQIEIIKAKGAVLAPVGHFDYKEQEFQWTIGIPGEKELFWNLNATQMMCYVALGLIFKDDIQLIHEGVLSIYHMKNVILWCAEQDSCQWTIGNFAVCLKTCINRLITFIARENFPHYFIEDRNLITSKMSSKVRERILKSLTKYLEDISNILSLTSFDKLKKITSLKVELLEEAKQRSIIDRCMRFYLETFSNFYVKPNDLWVTYDGHNTTINLKNAQDILLILKKSKRHYIRPYIAYANNMLGMLHYSRYMEKMLQPDLLKASELLRRSLTFENISLKIRVASFYLMEKEFVDCLAICDSFLSNPRKYMSIDEKEMEVKTISSDIIGLVTNSRNVTKLTELKEKMLALFNDICIPEQYEDKQVKAGEILLDFKLNKGDPTFLEKLETSHDALILVFENFTNLVFRDMSFNVPYLASEKWAVPEVIQYELLSVNKSLPESSVYGIYMDPMLNCLVLKFLSYRETDMLKSNAILNELIEYMNELEMKENKGKESQKVSIELPRSLPLYQMFNIVAYCSVKARLYDLTLHCIKYSILFGTSENNTAYGYIRCVCSILNNVYVR